MKYKVGDIVDYKLFKKSKNVYRARIELVNEKEKYYLIAYEDLFGQEIRDIVTDEELEYMFID